MSNPGADRPVFCVLSDEQRVEFERNIIRDLPPSIRLEFESQPDDALDRVGDLDPCLVIVGMTIEPMEGLEFLAMLMARYPDYHEKVLVLPEEGDPFPPMLQSRDRSTGRSTPEEIESDGIAQLIRSIAAPHLESQQVAKPAEPKPLAAVPKPAPDVASPAPAAVKPAPAAAQPAAPVAAKPPLPAAAKPATPAVANAPAPAASPKSPAPAPVATPQPVPPVARPKAAEPPSGVQKVAPNVQLEPAPVRSISGPQNSPQNAKPGAGSPLANLVMSAPVSATKPKHTGADALASTMLQGPPVVPPPAPPEAPAVQAPPAAPAPAAPPSAAQPPVPAQPPAAAVPPPRPGLALDFAATAPAGAQVPEAAAPPPVAAPAPGAPVVLGVKLPTTPQGTPPPAGAAVNPGAGVVPGAAPPAAAPAPLANPMPPAQASLLDKLPLGPLQNLPPEKRWIAWAALGTPVVLLVLLVVLLAFVLGGSDEPGETSNPADSPTGAAPAKTNDADEKAAPAPKKAKKQPQDVPASVAAAPPSDEGADDATAADETAEDEAQAEPAPASGSLAKRVTVPFAFARGQHDFTVTDKAEMAELVETIRSALKSNPDLRVEVGGHTSEEGSQRFNKLLGRQRADRVTAYLMRRGIPIERMIIKNYGSSLPSESGGNAAHRRVTVQLR